LNILLMYMLAYQYSAEKLKGSSTDLLCSHSLFPLSLFLSLKLSVLGNLSCLCGLHLGSLLLSCPPGKFLKVESWGNCRTYLFSHLSTFTVLVKCLTKHSCNWVGWSICAIPGTAVWSFKPSFAA
jgi:hypothetical protein